MGAKRRTPLGRRDWLIVHGAAIACVISGIVEVMLTTPAFRSPDQVDVMDAMSVVGLIVAPAVLVLCGAAMVRSWIAGVIAFAITACAASYWLVGFVFGLFGTLAFDGIHVLVALALMTLLAAAVAVEARSRRAFPTIPAVICITFGAASVAFYSTTFVQALQSVRRYSSFSDEMVVVAITAAWALVALCGVGLLFRPLVAAVVGVVVTVVADFACLLSVLLIPLGIFQFGPLALLLLYAFAVSIGPGDRRPPPTRQ